MPTIVSAVRDSDNMLTSGAVSRQTIALDEELDLFQDDATPFLVLTNRLGSTATGNQKYDWMTDDLIPYRDTVNGSVAASGTTIVVDNGSYWQAYDLFLIPGTGDVGRVTSVSTNDLTVTWITASPSAVEDGVAIWNIGNAFEEGADDITPKSVKETAHYNYCQIFRDSVGATIEQMATVMEAGGPDFPYQKRKKFVEHTRRIERALFWSERTEVTTGTHPYRTTRGIHNWITTNTTNIGGSVSRSNLDAAIRGVIDDGEPGVDKYYGITSSLVHGAVSRLGNTLERINTNADELGINIWLYHSPHGDVRFVVHPDFTAAPYNGTVYFLNMTTDNLKLRFLSGNGMNLKHFVRTNVQDPGKTEQVDELYSNVGLQIGNEKRHGRFYGITG